MVNRNSNRNYGEDAVYAPRLRCLLIRIWQTVGEIKGQLRPWLVGSHQNILAYFTPEGAILSDGLSGPAYRGDLYFIALPGNDPIGHMFVSEHRIGCCDSLTQYEHQHGQHLAEMETQKIKRLKTLKEAGCVLTRKYIRIIQVAI